MTGAPPAVWDTVVGQPAAVAQLSAAARGEGMTHAWLFTGPPGSGRSVAARAFAAALQCPSGGCRRCQACHTVLAGTHADVREVVPEGLTISVREMRALVQTAARLPSVGRWQVVVIEDADRLTEGAANALLKAVEEPPGRTVFLLCAPSDHPDDVPATIRSRCRVVRLGTPSPAAVAQVLRMRDGVAPDVAEWAASVSGGHVGRARRLAGDRQARERRDAVLGIPLSLSGMSAVFEAADALVGAAETEARDMSAERDGAEREALAVSMGAGGTGRGVAAAARGARAAEKELEHRQRSRATRTQRDALDRALVDLAGFYRDVLARSFGATVTPTHPDRAADVGRAAVMWTPESTLRRLEAVLACRDALELNVKPRIAVEALVTALSRG